MGFIHHVLLTTAGIPEHLAAEEAEVAELDAFCNIGQETFQGCHTINVEDVERVLQTHVVQALLYST
jgi:hypothetical protein